MRVGNINRVIFPCNFKTHEQYVIAIGNNERDATFSLTILCTLKLVYVLWLSLNNKQTSYPFIL